MKTYRGDLHIHIGRAAGKAVKITASKELTIRNILHTAQSKGLHIIGIVDCIAEPAQAELKEMLNSGLLTEMPEGGLLYQQSVVLIPGAEVETRESEGPAHWLIYFPTTERLLEFYRYWRPSVTNPNLSTQVSSLSALMLAEKTRELEGIFMPAHTFTPHKGALGSGACRLAGIFPTPILDWIKGIELGLSADTAMADRITELDGKTFFSNSDAHSLAKIGREYNLLTMANPNFMELAYTVAGHAGRHVAANYGLHPLLGKYHRSYCHLCNKTICAPPPAVFCPDCGGKDITLGVADRLEDIADRPPLMQSKEPPGRPPYRYQIPLDLIPGIGKATIDRLTTAFGSELAALHEAEQNDLVAVAGIKTAGRIMAARTGSFYLLPGGGGKYGQIKIAD
ncbi:MAG: TIGR00375 family protein [Syntrophomonadaceae bacterium]|nr:TIGR00375 family protein [Syntrophomonadaceae bacterium]